MPYRGGEICAVAKDKDGREIARNSLVTAGDDTYLSVLPEKAQIRNGQIAFVKLDYTDANGVVKPLNRKKVKVSVKGGKLLAVGNACPYNEEGYNGDSTYTYYGRALAVVKATGGNIEILATDGTLSGSAEIAVI